MLLVGVWLCFLVLLFEQGRLSEETFGPANVLLEVVGEVSLRLNAYFDIDYRFGATIPSHVIRDHYEPNVRLSFFFIVSFDDRVGKETDGVVYPQVAVVLVETCLQLLLVNSEDLDRIKPPRNSEQRLETWKRRAGLNWCLRANRCLNALGPSSEFLYPDGGSNNTDSNPKKGTLVVWAKKCEAISRVFHGLAMSEQ